MLPLPAAEATLRFELPQQAPTAPRADEPWAGQPLPISASCWHDGVLMLRLSGARAAVDAAATQLGGEAVGEAEAGAFWQAVREHRHAYFVGQGEEEALWRLSLPAATPALALPGAHADRMGRRAALAARRRRRPRPLRCAAGGHATLFRGGDARMRLVRGVFQPLDPVLGRIHRELKRAFDPHGVFNPGRLYADL